MQTYGDQALILPWGRQGGLRSCQGVPCTTLLLCEGPHPPTLESVLIPSPSNLRPKPLTLDLRSPPLPH